ncbi:MAG: tetratricopeptide repeat protein [Myxococcota bacterium]
MRRWILGLLAAGACRTPAEPIPTPLEPPAQAVRPTEVSPDPPPSLPPLARALQTAEERWLAVPDGPDLDRLANPGISDASYKNIDEWLARARRQLETLRTTDPAYSELVYSIGITAAGAAAYFDRRAAAGHEAADAEAQRHRLDAIDTLSRFADEQALLAFKNRDRAFYELATTLVAAKKYSEAQTAYARLIADHPKSALAPIAQLGLGGAHLAAGDVASAEAIYERVSAATRLPYRAYALYQLGWAALQTGPGVEPRWQLARQRWLAAIEASREDTTYTRFERGLRAAVRRSLPRVQIELGTVEDALAFFDETAARSSRDDIRMEQAELLAYGLLVRGRSADAAAVWTTLIDRVPKARARWRWEYWRVVAVAATGERQDLRAALEMLSDHASRFPGGTDEHGVQRDHYLGEAKALASP